MKLRDESGQTIVFTLLALVGVLGMTALVLDVGSWFRAQRDAQATADASALAGAQWLPDGPTAADRRPHLAGKNGGGVAARNITISPTSSPTDTIAVKASRPATSFFAQVLGVSSVTVREREGDRRASAQAKYVAPIVVSKNHPLLAGSGCPCFGRPRDLPLRPDGRAGRVRDARSAAAATAAWARPPRPRGSLPASTSTSALGGYNSDPGAKFSSAQVQNALSGRIGTVLLFPVFSSSSATARTPTTTIIGWVGFYLTGFDVQGNGDARTAISRITSHTEFRQAPEAGKPDFGVPTILLVG